MRYAPRQPFLGFCFFTGAVLGHFLLASYVTTSGNLHLGNWRINVAGITDYVGYLTISYWMWESTMLNPLVLLCTANDRSFLAKFSELTANTAFVIIPVVRYYNPISRLDKPWQSWSSLYYSGYETQRNLCSRADKQCIGKKNGVDVPW